MIDSVPAETPFARARLGRTRPNLGACYIEIGDALRWDRVRLVDPVDVADLARLVRLVFGGQSQVIAAPAHRPVNRAR